MRWPPMNSSTELHLEPILKPPGRQEYLPTVRLGDGLLIQQCIHRAGFHSF